MSNPVTSIQDQKAGFEIKKEETTIEKHLEDSITDEIVVGLCGPIGTDIKFVSDCLKEILEDEFNYTCIPIKLSTIIKKKFSIQESNDIKYSFDYYKELIDKGNELRKADGNNILAKLAIHKITSSRQEESKTEDELVKSKRHCYIIDSIKHLEEYELLKRVYGDIFYFIGVFSPYSLRIENLKNKGVKKTKVEELIEIDAEQKQLNHGQKVKDTFIKSDYFLRIEDSNEGKVKEKLERFIDLIFGTAIITPLKNETAMYLASSAAGNSACLSRQVGAAITDENGEILSVGWNDVPRAGGNLYPYKLNGESIDHRCMNKEGGKCYNDFEKDLITVELTEELINNKIIKVNQKELAIDILRASKIKGLIEFSRSVHAEMHAIINGSQKSGSKMINGKLFCTTYPCHNCARHIIAAGIKEVYYIEPYTKSLAIKLHSDALSESEEIDHNLKVKILMYDGVSPNRYMELFKIINERKLNGKRKKIKRKDATPKKSLSLEAIPILEQKATKELNTKEDYKDLLISII